MLKQTEPKRSATSPTEAGVRLKRTIRNRLLAHAEPAWGTPAQVVVLLTGSRSGSSTVFDVLRRSPSVAAMPGEIEPYLVLTGNARGADGSHAVESFKDRAVLRDLVLSDLHRYAIPRDEPAVNAWVRRWSLQWPDTPLPKGRYTTTREWIAATPEPRWYDAVPGHRPYTGTKLEEPPFVLPGEVARAESIDGLTLLFKTPQNVYRPGLFGWLFPSVPVRYVHLHRGYAQTVNGLMDGWRAAYGFQAHRVGGLSIAGYEDADWWCYDVPPIWKQLRTAPLWLVALMQWCSAHHAALQYNVTHRVAFEDIVADPPKQIARLADVLDIAPPADTRLTPMMQTAAARPARWRSARPSLATLYELPAVQRMMAVLGYDPDPDSWI